MKKLLLLLFSGILLAAANCYAQQDNKQPAKKSDKKILVVYYSHSGNTKLAAETVHKSVGGDIFEIEVVNPYPNEYKPLIDQAKKEQGENYRPPIKKNVANIKDYDIIFIGSPNWWGTIAMPVFTFLSMNDLSGNTVIPFITHEGSGLGRSVGSIKEQAPKADVKNAKAFRGGSVKNSLKEISSWAFEAVK